MTASYYYRFFLGHFINTFYSLLTMVNNETTNILYKHKKRIMYNELLPKNIHITQRIQGKVNF